MTREERMERHTARDHEWVCDTATVPEGAVTIHRAFAGLTGNERFVPCGFRSADFEEAYQHADRFAGSHRVLEHPHGDVDKAPRRSMHGSDYGGAYIDVVEPRAWHTDAYLRENVVR